MKFLGKIILAIFAVSLGLGILAGIRSKGGDNNNIATNDNKALSQQVAQEVEQADAPKHYVEIYAATGSGEKDTESFQTEGGKLKLTATTHTTGDVGSLSYFTLKSEEGRQSLDGNEVQITAKEGQQDAGSETIIRGAIPGSYYVSVNSGVSWEIHVFEEK